ncbi:MULTISPECIES: hypothetical protein [unclassified Bacillus (in: firmicutes)]|uniref:hypothetical protein n=1 Tax=unclassified Bacillus (in: firmicutes) TaxID=185979 RepID=UPI0008F0B94B|nr:MULTISPECIES: hypothetical protein [unclassified Bacillus (in: firmicutes)]SFA87634.1 hypothetical protein SAMN02799634_102249 [Bacillus sp. UNCCL13]SFQ84339.1 hypothetical protein SAMN04488577_2368 [Bacillus sp. cl95]
MMVCEWRPFSTDAETYSLQTFEETVGDEFESMMFTGDDLIPTYIWTVNFVIKVKRCSNKFTDISFEKIPRNPVCE